MWSIFSTRSGRSYPTIRLKLLANVARIFVPRFRNITTKSDKFLRGYALNVTSSAGPISPRNFAAYGAELDRKLREYHGSSFHMTIMGEVLGRYENHVRINKDKVDAWGIPVLHVKTKYTDNEFNMAKDAVEVGSAVAGRGI
jgi:hypothetical protein